MAIATMDDVMAEKLQFLDVMAIWETKSKV